MVDKQNLITGNKNGQKRLIMLSMIMFVTFLSFLIFEFSISMLALLIIEICFLSYLNWFVSKYFDVSVEAENIFFENIWHQKMYSRKDLQEIKLAHTIFPYPCNPFLILRFKNGVKVYSKIRNPHRIYFSKGGIELYISSLEDRIIKYDV